MRSRPQGVRYWRIAPRRGKKKAIVTVGRSILVAAWHLLTNPGTRYRHLGPDHFDRHVGADARSRNHVRQFQSLGYKVTFEPAA